MDGGVYGCIVPGGDPRKRSASDSMSRAASAGTSLQAMQSQLAILSPEEDEALLREADCRVVRVVDALNCERRADGAAGVVAGSRILLGSPEYLLDHDVDLSGIPPMEIDWSMLLVAADGRFAGIVRVTPE